MSLKFWKMHGLGNDFVVIDARQDGYHLTETQVVKIANRKRGIGFDQMLVIEKSNQADAYMRVVNSDGTTDTICGNGTRCVASFLMNESGRDDVTIDTLSGVLHVTRAGDLIRVDMGVPKLGAKEFPYAYDVDTLNVDLGYGLPSAVLVNMGNPHCVFFVEDAEQIALTELGSKLEVDARFLERANIEFCHLIAPGKIRMRVWERGTGITEACGSGACSVLVAASRRGLVDRKAEIVLDGGSLFIEWDANDRVIMTGPAAMICEGVLSDEFLDS